MTLEDVGPDNWRHGAALEVEMTLLINPVLVGQGTRLFPDSGQPRSLPSDRCAAAGSTLARRWRTPAVCSGGTSAWLICMPWVCCRFV